MYESQAFEDSAMSVFNTLDAVMEKTDGKVDEAISSLERAGRMHSKIKDFKPEYFKVLSAKVQDFNVKTKVHYRFIRALLLVSMYIGVRRTCTSKEPSFSNFFQPPQTQTFSL